MALVLECARVAVLVEIVDALRRERVLHELRVAGLETVGLTQHSGDGDDDLIDGAVAVVDAVVNCWT